jgi:hypothetical protein
MMPINLKLKAHKAIPLRRGVDHYWKVMMDAAVANEAFSARDVASKSDGNVGPVTAFIKRLALGGFLAVEDASGAQPTYHVRVKQSATPRVREDGSIASGVVKQAAMWNTMRSPSSRAGFTAQDLVVWGSTDDSPIAFQTARRYIAHLAKAGYLVQAEKGGKGKPAIWRLLPHMNTGPAYPMALMTKVIFDQNRWEVVGEASFDEVHP